MSYFAVSIATKPHRLDSKSREAKFRAAALLAILPNIATVVAYVLVSRDSQFFLVATFFLCLTASAGVSVILMAVLWYIGDYFKGDSKVRAFAGMLCCSFVGLPFFVLVPLRFLLKEGATINISQMIALGAVLTMLSVCFSSVAINARMKKLEGEKKAKVAEMKLVVDLRLHKVKIEVAVARIAFEHFSKFVQHNGTSLKEKQLKRAELAKFKHWLLSKQTIGPEINQREKMLEVIAKSHKRSGNTDGTFDLNIDEEDDENEIETHDYEGMFAIRKLLVNKAFIKGKLVEEDNDVVLHYDENFDKGVQHRNGFFQQASKSKVGPFPAPHNDMND